MDGELAYSSPHGALDLRLPAAGALPVVLSSPHSGREYSPEFIASSRLDPLSLRRSEDAFVDEIFASAARLGAPFLAARFPRAFLDVNREPYELDPAMFEDALPKFVNTASPRVRMGLGTIARIVASGEEIYAKPLSFAEAARRIEALYRPYHQTLQRLLAETESAFGGYLLIDCHSMPSGGGRARDGVDIVLGDCHGAACAAAVVAAARHHFEQYGLTVGLNAPYAGGFTTDHYGRPRRNRHALQIEINRALYMHERSFIRKPGFGGLPQLMAALVRELARLIEEILAASRPDPRRAAAD